MENKKNHQKNGFVQNAQKKRFLFYQSKRVKKEKTLDKFYFLVYHVITK